jgi:hypothetical protein
MKTILLSDLVGCDSLPHIVMTIWHTFVLNLKHAKQPLLSAAGCHTQPSKFKFKKKCDKLPLPSSAGYHTLLEGQHCPPRIYHGVFIKGGESL